MVEILFLPAAAGLLLPVVVLCAAVELALFAVALPFRLVGGLLRIAFAAVATGILLAGLLLAALLAGAMLLVPFALLLLPVLGLWLVLRRRGTERPQPAGGSSPVRYFPGAPEGGRGADVPERATEIRARAVGEGLTAPTPVVDPEVLDAYLDDASGRPRGRAAGLLRPRCEEEAAAFLRSTVGRRVRILPQGARTSLTGGAIPHGEVVISAERWTRIGAIQRDATGARVEVGAGVRLRRLQEAVAAEGCFYPPVPTYAEASLGGTVATNAGGAATFKYGPTRRWVRRVAVLLFNGDLLEVERGQVVARPGERFHIVLSDGRELSVPVPTYRLPALEKVSAGYHAADPLDLVDLFVGSEGTLGLIARVTVDLVERPPAVVTGLVFVEAGDGGLGLAARLREAARRARATGDPAGPDLRAIEWMDRRSLALLAESGDLDRLRLRPPPGSFSGLIFDLELPAAAVGADLREAVSAWAEGRSATREEPLARLLDILARHADLDAIELAMPGDERRSRALREAREAVPSRVNELLAQRRRSDSAVRKVGGDLIVPAAALPELARACEEAFARRGLEFAVWGHVADGNLHPNALPRDGREVEAAEDALLDLAQVASRLGGCPLSEHGVGRSALKQEMLRRFLGDEAIAEMWAIKRALDPEGRFAPGVLLPRLED